MSDCLAVVNTRQIVTLAGPARPRIGLEMRDLAIVEDGVMIVRGARIEAMTVGADRLVLALALPEGGRQLVVIDLATGTRLGAIELHATP